jgi:hypothetical protein
MPVHYIKTAKQLAFKTAPPRTEISDRTTSKQPFSPPSQLSHLPQPLPPVPSSFHHLSNPQIKHHVLRPGNPRQQNLLPQPLERLPFTTTHNPAAPKHQRRRVGALLEDQPALCFG